MSKVLVVVYSFAGAPRAAPGIRKGARAAVAEALQAAGYRVAANHRHARSRAPQRKELT